jgi:hypothetical protein
LTNNHLTFQIIVNPGTPNPFSTVCVIIVIKSSSDLSNDHGGKSTAFEHEWNVGLRC